MAKHIYIATRASGLKFTVITGKDTRKVVKFEKGQFQTEDDELANAIDDLIASNMNIRSYCKKADMDAALALAERHKKQMENTGAHKGGVSTIAMKNAMNTEMQARDAELQSAGVDKVAVANDESLILTEEGNTAPSNGLGKLVEDDAPINPTLNFGKKKK